MPALRPCSNQGPRILTPGGVPPGPSPKTVLVHPNFDPVVFSLGPLAVRWYGLMYLIGFGAAWALGMQRLKPRPGGQAMPLTRAQFDDVLFAALFGVIAGGRLGYVLFYKPIYYLSHPLEILVLWQGGMSFHGGFLGVLLAMLWIASRRDIRWLTLTDFIAPLVPLGLAAGRLGNFINGELWGRATDLPWGMVFAAADAQPRHPSQLYQFALEGIVLFAVLWRFTASPRPTGQASALFLTGYGILRFVAEFAREPDSFLGLLAFGFSMGQWLSLPMIAAGILLFAYCSRKPSP